jgi:hypothetical protein
MQIANSTTVANVTAAGIQAYTNSTVNSTVTASLLQVSNSTSTANLTAADLKIGSNTVVNSSQITSTLFAGNTATISGNLSSGNTAITGSLTVSTNVATIGTGSYFVSNGNVGVGTTSPSYKLQVNGSFAATTKSFIIDHPTKPDMKLRYGSLEGPENGVYVRGRTTSSVITLPDHWEGLVDAESITVSLTPIGKSIMPSVFSYNNKKVVLDVANNVTVDCFYHVFGERKDVDKLVVEF